MVFTRQKERASANPEYPPRTQPGTNIGEVCTPRWKVFTQEQNESFIQQVVQYYQEVEDEKLHYIVLGLNWSSAEDDTKKPIVPWLVNFPLKKIRIHNFLM